jgi:hypothetical protein
MATDQAAVRSPAAGKHDAFVAEQLARAERRIRILDLFTAGLGFVGGSCLFAGAVMLADRRWQLSAGTRQLALLLYLLAAAGYLWLTVVRPLWRRINPYYAALQVEHTIPGAKNSVINWIDLHDQRMAPAIRTALSHRAARDLAQADLEEAISGRRAFWTGGAAVLFGMFLGILLLLFGPGQFGSLLGRALAPFKGSGGIAYRTRLQILKPDENGNATIPAGRAITIAVLVEGRIPDPRKADAVRLHWRYDPNGTYQTRLLQEQESTREWATVLSVADAREGFWYKVTGGDYETPEYRVEVVAAPMVTDFQATYHYRPYLRKDDEVRRDRKIEALCGTEVAVQFRANRTIKSGQMFLENRTGKETLPAQAVAGAPGAWEVRLVLKDSGLYRLGFQATTDEIYVDPLLYPIQALQDRTPEVEITKPEPVIHLQANGVLRVEGNANDDIGVKSVALHMKPVGGPLLKPKEYLADKGGLVLPHGDYPLTVAYKDFVDLAQVQTNDGKPYTLQPGMELEYWLEAADACDFPPPGPNVGKSKKQKVILDPPHKDKAKQQQERDQAKKEQQEHEAKQNEERKNEDKARQEKKEQQKQEAEKNQGQQQNQNEGNQGQDQGKPKEDQNLRDQADRIKKEIEKQEQNGQGGQQGDQEKPGQPKTDQPRPGESKEGGEKKEGQEQKQAGERGQGKEGGGQGEKNQAAEKKEGSPDKNKGEQGMGKEAGQPDPKNAQKGESKGGDSRTAVGDGQPGEAKEGGKPEKVEGKPGQAKSGQPQGGAQETGQEKTEGKPGEQGKPADTKQSGAGGQTADKQPAANAKGNPAPENKATAKEGGADGPKKDQSTAKSGPDGTQKPGEGKQGDPKTAQGEAKDKSDRVSPEDQATLTDIAKAVEDLKSPDRAKREQGAKRLEEIKKETSNPQMRDFVQRVQDMMDKQPENQTAQAKERQPSNDSKQPMGPPGEPCAECKGGGESKEGAAGKPGAGGKPGQGQQGEAKEGGKQQGPPMGNDNNPEGKEKGDGKSIAKGKGAPKQGLPPGGGLKAPTGQELRDGMVHNPEEELTKPGDPLSQRATETQLEDFKKKLDKKMLERLKMTEEARQKFLRDYADLIKRDQAVAEKPEVVPPAQQGGSVPTSVGRKPTGPAAGSTGDTAGPSRGLPPPGFRPDYEEFTRLLSTPPSKKKD